MKETLAARFVGNFLFGFCTTFAAINLISNGVLDSVALQVGLITATVQGLLALSIELKDYGAPKKKGFANNLVPL